ncbi:MAG: DUF2771 family protein [Jatrophihabitans sp.]
MSYPSHRARLGAGALGLLALGPALAGCSKAQTGITLLSNDRSSTVAAQPACTMLSTGGCDPVASKQGTIQAHGGSKIVIEVPKQLASAGWIVSAYTTDGKTNTALQTPTGVSTGPLRGQRSVQLNVPTATTGSYYLQVTALHPSTRLTNWLCLVQLVP